MTERKRAMYCAYGHAITDGNIVIRRNSATGQVIGRRCKICNNRYARESYARKAAEKSAGK